jgi:hypothetical protein
MRHGWTLLAALGTVGTMAAIARPSSAWASLVVELDTPSMVRRADHVAVVDVVAARAAWDDKHERIVSTIELAVVETWKGTNMSAARLTVVQPGGTVGDLTMVVFGMPRFSPGERALVFLAGPADHAAVVGMTQGKRRVRRGQLSRRLIVEPPARAGASFIQVGAPGAVPRRILEPARSLDDMRAEVRALVDREGTR